MMMIKNVHYSDIQYVSFSKLFSHEQAYYRNAIYNFLWRLNFEYTDFRKWYNGLFSENATLNNGREIIICFFQNQIAGVSILKKSNKEKKICTLRVAKKFQKQGIGKDLILKSIEWLETDKPLITVRSSKAYQFEKLFQYFGFKQESIYYGYYSWLSSEIAYNGNLPTTEMGMSSLLLTDMRAFLEYYIRQGTYTVDELFNMYLQHCCENFLI